MTRDRKYDENGRCITHKQSELLDFCLECAKEDWEDSNLNMEEFTAKNEAMLLQIAEVLKELENFDESM